ncbi:hypothetical protein PL11_001315 [Lentilactobacillus curieae]|uniref:Glycosyltransferase, catalytic subunit of cellulose synthase and poly-beta-1,6-N-acetylglucosamine synthase n=1 Tax=Lentilactobacillus curieae TaxID=1138822 RepID=A0A1S6QGA5_9LACO|nr:glycosyltransferase family 2 protein [Lentilactobacillus curieae]AQW20646.1 hypothetical protein PL11_001315 [Lentilactobacillus curieae]
MLFFKVISTFLTAYIFIYMLYYNLLSILGYAQVKEHVPSRLPNKKFLVVIPAHNEETVISIPVKGFLEQTYPQELFDIYVIADHCNDQTALVARTAGANVITSEDYPKARRHGVGKSNTIDFGLQCIEHLRNYDYLVIVDSDNEISPNLLQRYNDYATVKSDPEAMQTSLLSKKGRGFINHGLNVAFKRSNHFQQSPESLFDCASLLGTGFATRMDIILVHGGFRFKTLVEDEYEELEIISHGGRVNFIDDAYVVNENYSTFRQSIHGLTRWSRGSFECLLRFFFVAMVNMILRPSVKSIHVFCRISTLSKAIQINILWIFWLVQYIEMHYFDVNILFSVFSEQEMIVILIINLTMTFNLIFAETYYLLIKDLGMLKTFWMMAKTYGFQLYYQGINVWAVLTFFKKKWIVTTHGE